MQTKLGTQIIGDVFKKLNPVDVEQELLALKSILCPIPYLGVTVGVVRVYPLWNQLGDAGNANLYGYDGAAKITDIGIKSNHISQMVKDTFDVNFLKLCRIHELTKGAFLLPHRDYLDGCQQLEETYTRIHIPLKTQEKCWLAYEEELYHMGFGEIYLHDGSFVHSAGNFSSESRFHLILDFDPNIPLKDLFKDKTVLKFKEAKVCDREPFSEGDLDDILNLAVKVINSYNFRDIFVLLSKIHFQQKVSCSLTFDWLQKVVEQTGNEQLIEMSKKTKQGYIGL
ncbi:MAG: aspartyl/asparaginyl beta-hydroxylase domain-containing protein [Microcoleaceae cyanobacterium]